MLVARVVFALLAALSLSAVSPAASAAADGGWTPLLDKDMSKWRTYLSFRHRNGYAGKPPVDERGEPIAPVGYDKDPDRVFTVTEENGEPVLRVSGEVYGCVFTKDEFENYDLRLKVKWGEKKWEPRTELLRDSGVLYHSVGEAGVDYWRSWMLSQEFQIMEGHVGDYWPQANSGADVRAFLPEGGMIPPVASERQPFLPFGAGSKYGGFVMRSEDRETPGGWTEVELICFGDKALHVVNGKVVLVLKNSRYGAGADAKPLAKGRIQLQSEAAEVFYKDVRVRKIDALPKEYAAYFD